MSTALPIAVGDVFHDWTVVEIVPWKGRRWLRMRCVCRHLCARKTTTPRAAREGRVKENLCSKEST
jgi:hypothetical protein